MNKNSRTSKNRSYSKKDCWRNMGNPNNTDSRNNMGNPSTESKVEAASIEVTAASVVFAFLNPGNAGRMVLAMAVNPLLFREQLLRNRYD